MAQILLSSSADNSCHEHLSADKISLRLINSVSLLGKN